MSSISTERIRSKVVLMTGVVLLVALPAAIPALAQTPTASSGRTMDVFVTNDEATPVPVTGAVSVTDVPTSSPFQVLDSFTFPAKDPETGEPDIACVEIGPPAGTVVEVRHVKVTSFGAGLAGADVHLSKSGAGSFANEFVWRMQPSHGERDLDTAFFLGGLSGAGAEHLGHPTLMELCFHRNFDHPGAFIVNYLVSGFQHPVS